jgi:PTS system N-acetylglucosamine-specific IIC component
VIVPRAPTAGTRGGDFVLALGGASNLATVDACMTRLRLTVKDPAAVDEIQLRALGAKGIVRPGGNALQVVLGPIADQVAGEIRSSLHTTPEVADDGWFEALGGADNVEEVRQRSTRLIVTLADIGKLNETELKKLGVRAVTHSAGGRIHILLDEPGAMSVSAALQPA